MRLLFALLLCLPPSLAIAETPKVVYVEGMTCPSCAASVEKEFKHVDKVKKIEIRLKEGKVTLHVMDGKNLSDEKIKDTITKAGFTVKSIE